MAVILTCDICGQQFFFNKWRIATDLWIGPLRRHVSKHLYDQEQGKEPLPSKANEITAMARKMVEWVRDNAGKEGCKKCGSNAIKIAGMDTDTMWLRCNGCGNMTEHDLASMKKENVKTGEHDENQDGK